MVNNEREIFIAIPSRGRPQCKTAKHFINLPGYKTLIFVEPHQEQDYLEHWPREVLHVIDRDNAGLPYVRKYIMDFARANSEEVFCMLDDDLESMGFVRNGRSVTFKNNEHKDMIRRVINEIKAKGFAAGTLAYRQRAWSEQRVFQVNNFPIEVFMILNLTQIPPELNFDEEFLFKSDREFTIRLLLAGKDICRFNRFFFNSGKMGAAKGGQYDGYQQKRDHEYVGKLIARYPGICSLVEKKDRPDAKIDYKLARYSV